MEEGSNHTIIDLMVILPKEHHVMVDLTGNQRTKPIRLVHYIKVNYFVVGLFECKINSDVFHFWVEHFLIPELPRHCVILMDNATHHERIDIQELLEQPRH